jgi:hypothetical protein
LFVAVKGIFVSFDHGDGCNREAEYIIYIQKTGFSEVYVWEMSVCMNRERETFPFFHVGIFCSVN